MEWRKGGKKPNVKKRNERKSSEILKDGGLTIKPFVLGKNVRHSNMARQRWSAVVPLAILGAAFFSSAGAPRAFACFLAGLSFHLRLLADIYGASLSHSSLPWVSTGYR